MESKLSLIEWLVSIAIFLTIAATLLITKEKVVEPVAEESSFYDFPLDYWFEETDKGTHVHIRYLITRDDTKLYVYDNKGKAIHVQPFSLDPHDDDRERIFTYVWKLYPGEWHDAVDPGEYTIRLKIDGSGDWGNIIETKITI